MKNRIIKAVALLICLAATVSFVTACGDKEQKGNNKSNATYRSIEFKLVECDDIGILKMQTNLPIGTELTVRMVSGSKNIDTSTDAVVELIDKERYIVSQPVKDKDGKFLPDGKYTSFIQTKPAAEQPEKIQNELGTKCESLTGVNVYADSNGKFAKVLRAFVIENGKFKDGKAQSTSSK